jgi:hypothetical protein
MGPVAVRVANDFVPRASAWDLAAPTRHTLVDDRASRLPADPVQGSEHPDTMTGAARPGRCPGVAAVRIDHQARAPLSRRRRDPGDALALA